MILSLLLFLGSGAVLLLEGRLFLVLVAGKTLTRKLQWVLGFPLAAFGNALLFFLCTLLSLPLTALCILSLHALLLALLGFLFSRMRKRPMREEGRGEKTTPDLLAAFLPNVARRALVGVLLLFLCAKLLYGISHSVFLPTFYYDSLSQWTMRARVSYEDRAMAFDATEERGISKPQYPILLHSLQIFSMLPQGEWRDPVANGAILLLTLSCLAALFLFLRERAGFSFVLFGVSAFFSSPLLSMHIGQGYGDLPVILFLLLSAILFVSFAERKERGALLLSALFVAAAAWVKQEGLFFGVLPWIGVIAAWFLLQGAKRREDLLYGVAPALLLGSLWTLFLIGKGLPISAHAGDFSFAFHPEAIPPLLRAFFTMGSFGLVPFLLPLGFLLIAPPILRRWKEHVPALLIVAWGLLTFAETLIVYIFTPNVNFLLNGQTFSRTMLMPLTLCIAGVLLLWERRIRSAK